jgi:hypothetical protein
VLAVLFAQAASSGPGPLVPPEALVGFGAASPIVVVLLWLLARAEAARAEAVADARAARSETIQAYKATLPVASESSAALTGTTQALTALTVEVRRSAP